MSTDIRPASSHAARDTLEATPVFALHTVLYPEGPLPLRVFEPRYVDMVSDRLRRDAPFIVALIREGSEVGGGAGGPHVARCGPGAASRARGSAGGGASHHDIPGGCNGRLNWEVSCCNRFVTEA